MKLLIVLLTTLFIYLKLIGSITWSWVWVLSPLWGSLLLFVLFFFLVIAFYEALK